MWEARCDKAALIGTLRGHVAFERDTTDNHRLLVCARLLGIGARAQRLAASTLKGQSGGIHEHQAQIGEQVATALEELLLDHIFHTGGMQMIGTCRMVRSLQSQTASGSVSISSVSMPAVRSVGQLAIASGSLAPSTEPLTPLPDAPRRSPSHLARRPVLQTFLSHPSCLDPGKAQALLVPCCKREGRGDRQRHAWPRAALLLTEI